MSRTLVKRVSRIVDRHASRRGFLRTSAMTATAMAVAPVVFATRPTSAEAAIVTCLGHRCSPGAACCDGWTEFCCRVTGENTCPPGTVVAGWWKVDDSEFCTIDEPRPRYYIDCNLACDPGCGCGSSGMCSKGCTSARCSCADGCDTRRVDCARFRYGQCNQDVCVGRIKCRVVTCVPPWIWDPSCRSAPVLSDEETRGHDRPCLHVGFTDVPPKAFYAEAVEWMTDEDITAGLTNDLFGPDEPVQRAQFATFLWRYAGQPAPSLPNGFDDVPAGSYYEEAVAWMAENGITAGLAPRKFGSSAPVSRVQVITFLHRLAGSPPPTSAPSHLARASFAVEAEDAWYADALDWAVSRDILWWSPPLSFDLDLSVSRAEAAVFLHRFHLSRSADEPSGDGQAPGGGTGPGAGAGSDATAGVAETTRSPSTAGSPRS